VARARRRCAREAERRAAWRRLYDHALGLLHGPQERIEEARPSLVRARTLADSPIARAMIASLSAQIAVAEGRTSEAMEELDRASVDAPGHPAIAAIRGEAWRACGMGDATTPLGECTRAAPGDSSAWARFALAAGSQGDAKAALDACARGLALSPRDADMLRMQALALEQLGAPREITERAKGAYLTYRSPDDAPKIRAACARNVAGCALERVPVHVHSMRAAP